MPAGFAGFPRDPSSDQPVGIAQSVLSKPAQDKKPTPSPQQTRGRGHGYDMSSLYSGSSASSGGSLASKVRDTAQQ